MAHNKVKGYRAMLGLTQKQIAELLGITPQSYSSKEIGIRSFKDSEKIKLKELFGEIDANLTIDSIFFNQIVSKSKH